MISTNDRNASNAGFRGLNPMPVLMRLATIEKHPLDRCRSQLLGCFGIWIRAGLTPNGVNAQVNCPAVLEGAGEVSLASVSFPALDSSGLLPAVWARKSFTLMPRIKSSVDDLA